jgi:hypothetical protein
MGIPSPVNLNLSPQTDQFGANGNQTGGQSGGSPSSGDQDSGSSNTPGSFSGKRYARSRPSPNGGAGSASGGGEVGGSEDSGSSSASNSQSGSSDFGSQGKKHGSHHRRNFEQSHSLVSITRPVKLECHADRLVMISEDGDPSRNKVIPLNGFIRDSVDQLETEIHERIGSWGMAGRGMQWHPIVVVNVAPDGAARYAALQPMLKSDGLEVRDKNAPTLKTYSR